MDDALFQDSLIFHSGMLTPVRSATVGHTPLANDAHGLLPGSYATQESPPLAPNIFDPSAMQEVQASFPISSLSIPRPTHTSDKSESSTSRLAAAQRRLLELLPLPAPPDEVSVSESLLAGDQRSKRRRRAGPRGKYAPWTGVSQVFKNKRKVTRRWEAHI